jgi:phosphohistidine phosphatase SixA
VIAFRHALAPATYDPPGFQIGDCSTQRNLNDEGRAQAQRIGAWFKARSLRPARVRSSPWCRCVDTAQLAFGRVDERWPALNNLFGRPANREAQVQALRPRIAAYRGKGNLVLVSHGSTTLALAGVSPQQGEIVVLTPGGPDGFRVAGRLAPP